MLLTRFVFNCFDYLMLKHEKDRGEMKQIQRSIMEKIFKYTCIVLLMMLIYCTPGFLAFKNYAHQNNIHYVSSQAWYWCIAGFIIFGLAKQSYYYLFVKYMGFIVKPKFECEQKVYRLKSIAKQSFDTLFYLSTSVTGYYLFRNQYWFPRQAGGVGECQYIFREYPNWPSEQTTKDLEWFYMLQLGKFLYSVAESVIFRRADRKYYEFLLHHFVATTLILFSMLTNLVAVGAVILIIHDLSDIPSAFIRGFIDTKYDNLPTGLVFFGLWLGSWSYLRAYVFPTCLIQEVYNTYVGPSRLWPGIRLQFGYLGVLCSVLVLLHIFWIILLTKYAWDIVANQKEKSKVKNS